MALVSVIIPAYNKADYTCRAVESVLRQTYKPLEIIVVDDGSTDDTRQRLQAYGDRIIYIAKPNGGASSARNVGIRQAQGEYVAFLDCDDLYLPNKIEASVEYLKEHPKVGFVHTVAYLMDRDDSVVSIYVRPDAKQDGWISKRLIAGNFIANSTVVTRAACLRSVGFFDETIFTPADWDLWLRLAEQYPAAYLDAPLTKYRISDNYIFNKLELAQQEEAVVIQRYFDRNPSVGQDFKNTILANWHLRFAQCYVVKEDTRRVKAEFKEVMRLDPRHPKAWLFWVLFICARPFLKSVLRKKILRYQ